MESIWVYKKSYGINWYIVQAEIKLPNIFHSYIFDNTKSNDSISNHQDYRKFFKMVNMGVPKEAVKIKMNMEGLDGEIIFLEPTTLSTMALKKNNEMRNIHPLPPPPMPSNNLQIPKKINPSDLIAVKLKKVDKNNIEKHIEEDLRIPTQGQLLDQLRKLKKIN